MRARFAFFGVLVFGLVPGLAGAQQPPHPHEKEDPLAPVAGGITAEQVGARAVETSFQVQAVTDLADAAGARVDQAGGYFFPRLTASARYARLSDFTPIELAPATRVAATNAPPGTVNPNPTQSVQFGPIFVPTIVDAYLVQATLLIPVSDYFLKIGKAYSAATQASEAAQWDLVAAKAKSQADGKLAYYTWVRARGAQFVAEQTLAVAKVHLRDTEITTATGASSRADSLRAKTAVAASELLVERARNGAVLAERQVRIATHAKETERMEPGENLDKAPGAPPSDLRALIAEAHSNRPELKSLERNAEAQRKLASAARAGHWPSLGVFADAVVANPNLRRFPPRSEWFPTWAVGAQLSWTPTDIMTSSGHASESEAKASALEAQRNAAKDGIELEVRQAHNQVLEADVAIATTARQLESATESYRVAKELYSAGRGTSTALTDVENALTQARFESLNARVDARVSRVRLDHALGRDAKR